MKKTLFSPMLCSSVLLLSACGGSSETTSVDYGYNEPAVAAPRAQVGAEGYFEGTASNGKFVKPIILENGRMLIVYGTNINGVEMPFGVIEGTGQSVNSSYSVTNGLDLFNGGSTIPLTVSATYQTGSTLAGSFNTADNSVSFTSTAPATTLYDYNRVASLSEIHQPDGWDMADTESNVIILGVAVNGNIFGSLPNCGFSGKFTRRASGKNVFDMNIQFGKGCPVALENKTASGAAVVSMQASGKRQLVLAAVTSDRQGGIALAGVQR